MKEDGGEESCFAERGRRMNHKRDWYDKAMLRMLEARGIVPRRYPRKDIRDWVLLAIGVIASGLSVWLVFRTR
jgi:hypothetical protein